MTDLEKVMMMEDMNWKPASNYWAERYSKEKVRADIAEAKLAECLERNALLEAQLGKAVELLTLCRDMFDEVAHPSDPLSRMLNDDLAFERWGEQP